MKKKIYRALSFITRINLSVTEIIVITIVLITGLLCIFFGKRDLSHSIDSSNWPGTKGVILESYLSEHEDNDTSVTSYDPMIKYSYTVNGKTYINDLVNYDYINRGKEWAENVIADYPENQQVTVFYKPDKPEFSVLETGVTASTYIPIYFGYVSIALGVIYLLIRFIWSVWRK